MAKKTTKFNPIKIENTDEASSRVIWSTDAINQAIAGLNKGQKLVARPFYDNNTFLLKSNLLFQRTDYEVEEYIRCMEDVVYFAEHYCKLMTPKGIQIVQLRDYQKEYLKHLQNNRLSIFLSCRQSGKTTTSAVFILWYILFNVDKNALVLGNKGKTAREILNKIKSIFLYIPYFLKPGIYKWNEGEIVLDNNTRVMSETTTINSGISFTYHIILADEFAHIPPNICDKFYSQIFPTITAGNARFIISSTQNGFNLFYKLYRGAEMHENEYAPFKVDWYQVPEWNRDTEEFEMRDDAWRVKQIANLGSEEAFQMQFGTNFLVTGNTLIGIKKIRDVQRKAIEFLELDMPGLRYSEYFKWNPSITDIQELREKFIIMTIDMSEGLGGDYTVIQFHESKWDDRLGRTYQECIGYFECNSIEVEMFAEVVVDLVTMFIDQSKSLLCYETNIFGNLFYKSIDTYIENKGISNWDDNIFVKFLKNSEQTGSKKHYRQGFKVTSNSKKEYCTVFKSMYESGKIVNNSTRFITQLENFKDDKGSGSYASSFGNDDLVMCSIQLAAVMNTIQYTFLEQDVISYKDINRDDEGSNASMSNMYDNDEGFGLYSNSDSLYF